MFFNFNFTFMQMFKKVSGICTADKCQRYIFAGILVQFTSAVDEISNVSIDLIVAIGSNGRADAFDFYDIKFRKNPGNIFGNWFI